MFPVWMVWFLMGMSAVMAFPFAVMTDRWFKLHEQQYRVVPSRMVCLFLGLWLVALLFGTGIKVIHLAFW